MSDLTFDQWLYDQAKNEPVELSKDEVIRYVASILDIGATKENAALDPISGLVVKLSPLGQPKSTNARWRMLSKVVDQIPKELWRGQKQPDGTVISGVLTSINFAPIFQDLIDKKEFSSTQENEAKKSVPIAEKTYTDLQSAKATAGLPTGDGSTTMPGSQYFSPSAFQGTAQEFAQANIDTTLADLGFDETLRFSFRNLIGGAPADPTEGYDVAKAPAFLYSLSAEQLGKLSGALQRAGYFDLVGSVPNDPTDNRDRAIRTAWDLFLVDVVAAGKQAKPQDVLNSRIQANMKDQMPFGATYADPATLRTMANEFGRALIDRNLTAQEQDSFIAVARQWEKEAIRKFGIGQDKGTFTTDQDRVDVQSRAELYFQRNYATTIAKNLLSEWASGFK